MTSLIRNIFPVVTAQSDGAADEYGAARTTTGVALERNVVTRAQLRFDLVVEAVLGPEGRPVRLARLFVRLAHVAAVVLAQRRRQRRAGRHCADGVALRTSNGLHLCKGRRQIPRVLRRLIVPHQ